MDLIKNGTPGSHCYGNRISSLCVLFRRKIYLFTATCIAQFRSNVQVKLSFFIIAFNQQIVWSSASHLCNLLVSSPGWYLYYIKCIVSPYVISKFDSHLYSWLICFASLPTNSNPTLFFTQPHRSGRFTAVFWWLKRDGKRQACLSVLNVPSALKQENYGLCGVADWTLNRGHRWVVCIVA